MPKVQDEDDAWPRTFVVDGVLEGVVEDEEVALCPGATGFVCDADGRASLVRYREMCPEARVRGTAVGRDGGVGMEDGYFRIEERRWQGLERLLEGLCALRDISSVFPEDHLFPAVAHEPLGLGPQ